MASSSSSFNLRTSSAVVTSPEKKETRLLDGNEAARVPAKSVRAGSEIARASGAGRDGSEKGDARIGGVEGGGRRVRN